MMERAEHPSPALQRTFGNALMAIAGWVDAAGFILFGQLYVSFMSGDATQLGLLIGGSNWWLAGKFFAAQLLFVFGAGLGRYVRLRRPEKGRRRTLWINVVLLAAVAILGTTWLAIPAFVLAVVAMGSQNAIMTHEVDVPIGTMVTGALARLGEAIAARLLGRPGEIRINLAQWFFFVLGAVGGGVSFMAMGASSFWVPAVASGLLLPLATRLPTMIEKPTATLA